MSERVDDLLPSTGEVEKKLDGSLAAAEAASVAEAKAEPEFARAMSGLERLAVERPPARPAPASERVEHIETCAPAATQDAVPEPKASVVLAAAPPALPATAPAAGVAPMSAEPCAPSPAAEEPAAEDVVQEVVKALPAARSRVMRTDIDLKRKVRRAVARLKDAAGVATPSSPPPSAADTATAEGSAPVPAQAQGAVQPAPRSVGGRTLKLASGAPEPASATDGPQGAAAAPSPAIVQEILSRTLGGRTERALPKAPDAQAASVETRDDAAAAAPARATRRRTSGWLAIGACLAVVCAWLVVRAARNDSTVPETGSTTSREGSDLPATAPADTSAHLVASSAPGGVDASAELGSGPGSTETTSPSPSGSLTHPPASASSAGVAPVASPTRSGSARPIPSATASAPPSAPTVTNTANSEWVTDQSKPL